MKFYTHVAAAILFFLCFVYILNIESTLLCLFAVSWIAVFPDLIDRAVGRHRGMGHSMIWIVPFTLLGIFDFTVAVAVVIGFLSHLFLDVFTVHGCPLLYPLKKTKFVALSKKRRIRTGTNQDRAVFIFIFFLILPFSFMIGGIDLLFPVFAETEENVSNDSSRVEKKMNVYLTIESGENKNISIQEGNETISTIIIDDI